MRAIDFVSDYGVSLASLHKLGDEITKNLKFETLYASQDNAFPGHWRSPVSLEPRMLAEFQQTKLAVYNGADLIVKEPTQRGQEMTIFAFATVLSLGMVTMAASATAQQGHGHPHGMDIRPNMAKKCRQMRPLSQRMGPVSRSSRLNRGRSSKEIGYRSGFRASKARRVTMSTPMSTVNSWACSRAQRAL